MMTFPQPSLPSSSFPALDEKSFDALMQACGSWEDFPSFAVAVSGGPDSMALAVLLKEWLGTRGGKLLALHVDHGLRENSGEEASLLGQRLTSLSISHQILRWEHQKPPQSAIHLLARRARYDLLFNACRQNNIWHLFLAHHADDQAETVLMRLARSTGIDGLAGMAAKREQDGLLLVRPLLPVRKASLQATCRVRNIKFLEDPSNAQPRFERGKLRGMQPALAEAGFDTEKLYNIAREAGEARAQMETFCNDWLQAHATFDNYGSVAFPPALWKTLPPPLRQRLLNRVLMAVGGSEYPPRGASLQRLETCLIEGSEKAHTLNGCLIQFRKQAVLFSREEGMACESLSLRSFSPHQRWDNRFVLHFHPAFEKEKFSVRRLGQISRNLLLKKRAETVAALPASMRASLPGLFDDSGLVHVPEFAGESPKRESQALVTAIFSPPQGFLVKPFCPSSSILA